MSNRLVCMHTWYPMATGSSRGLGRTLRTPQQAAVVLCLAMDYSSSPPSTVFKEAGGMRRPVARISRETSHGVGSWSVVGLIFP